MQQPDTIDVQLIENFAAIKVGFKIEDAVLLCAIRTVGVCVLEETSGATLSIGVEN